MRTNSTLPSRHKHKDEILYYQNLIGFSDEIANKLYSMTRGLSNEKFYKYLDYFFERKNGTKGKYFFKSKYVTVVTSAIYQIVKEINADLNWPDEKKFNVTYLLDNVLFVKNSNRSRYTKMLATIAIQNPAYCFTHPDKQGDPSPKIHKRAKERKIKIKRNGLFRYFNKEEVIDGTTISK